jgi:PAS domain S-box-containing protein
MHRALQGLSGTMIGIDHDGVLVLAAYEPVEVLDLGIVSKIDMAELRAPFIRAGLLVAGISLGLVAAGAWLFVSISRPMIRDLEEHSRHLERLVQALRDSEERFRYTFEQAAVGVAHVAPEGSFIRVNSRFCEITGYTAEELAGIRARQLSHPADWEAAAANVAKAVAGELDSFTSEGRFVRKDGAVIWVDNTVSLVHDEHGQARYFIAIVADATDRKRAEGALKALLDEKDVLLREIHHRVKNNLQVVSSLLNLQALKVEDDTLRRLFQESQSRIRAMALIHETLHDSRDLSRIELHPYFTRVGDSLIGMYGSSAARIRLRVEADRVALSIDDTVPCGLIINELLSNSLKHAFPDGRGGEVRIAASVSPAGRITLEVCDNGIGLPDDLDIHNTSTMGMRLVTGLAENQLGGTIEVDRRAGTAFRISFHPGGRRISRSA